MNKQKIIVSQKVQAWKNTTYAIEADTSKEAWESIKNSIDSEALDDAIISITFEESETISTHSLVVIDDTTGNELESD